MPDAVRVLPVPFQVPVPVAGFGSVPGSGSGYRFGVGFDSDPAPQLANAGIMISDVALTSTATQLPALILPIQLAFNSGSTPILLRSGAPPAPADSDPVPSAPILPRPARLRLCVSPFSAPCLAEFFRSNTLNWGFVSYVSVIHPRKCAKPSFNRRSASLSAVLRGGAASGGGRVQKRRSRPRAASRIDGADDGVRTRDPDLGKVVLYQLSHVRICKGFRPEKRWRRRPDSNRG